jgi:hypothetical protein
LPDRSKSAEKAIGFDPSLRARSYPQGLQAFSFRAREELPQLLVVHGTGLKRVLRMSLHSFPSAGLAQVVRMTITRDAEGWLVAKSGDLPGRICTARSEDGLADRIEETIRRSFAEEGTGIRVTRPRGQNDLAVWHVEELSEAEASNSR